jgi:hypothetical protein
MIQRPTGVTAFEFVVLAALRSAQLMRGCTPRVDGAHKTTVTAQLEIAAGRVVRLVEVQVVPELVPSVSTSELRPTAEALSLNTTPAMEDSGVADLWRTPSLS